MSHQRIEERPAVIEVAEQQMIARLGDARESVSFAELAVSTGDLDPVRECIEEARANLYAANKMAEVL